MGSKLFKTTPIFNNRGFYKYCFEVGEGNQKVEEIKAVEGGETSYSMPLFILGKLEDEPPLPPFLFLFINVTYYNASLHFL